MVALRFLQEGFSSSQIVLVKLDQLELSIVILQDKVTQYELIMVAKKAKVTLQVLIIMIIKRYFLMARSSRRQDSIIETDFAFQTRCNSCTLMT